MSTEDTIIMASEQKAAATEEKSLADLSNTSDESSAENAEELASSGDSSTEDAEALEAKENEESEGDEDSEDNQPDKKKKPGGFQKRIAKLNGKLSAKDQEIEFLRRQVLDSQNAKAKGVTEIVRDMSTRPKADDFATSDEYTEALTDWKVDQKLQAEKVKAQQEAMRSEFQGRLSKHQERVNTFKESHNDFEDVIEGASDVSLPIAVQESIIDSDNGAELMYELSKDKKELKRICALSPLAAAREIGKIESRLGKPEKASPSKETKTTTSPKPPTPVRSKGVSVTKGFRSDMSLREYDEWRNEQSKGKRA